jgi:hypothetical protein
LTTGALAMFGLGCSSSHHGLSTGEVLGGYKSLFDGETLDNWTSLDSSSTQVITGDDASFSVQDGVMYCRGEGKDYWIRENNPYGDFVLRLEYKVGENTNSGIFLRVPPDRHPAFSGFEIQVLEDHGKPPGKHSAGALYDVVAPSENASKPAGAWNEVEIRCEGPICVVVLNGKKILDVNFDDEMFHQPIGKFDFPYKDLPRKGYFGVQNHGGKIWYRNVRVKEL